MKLFTRCFLLSATLLLPLFSTFAATVTVQVGDNFYQASDGTNIIRMAANDVLVFKYIGALSHPTMSDNSPAAFPLFQMNAANTVKQFGAGAFTPGTYPFHCTAHGGPGVGQFGTLIVGVATATLDPRLAAAITVYPNPSRGQVTVQLTQKLGSDYQLRLSNIIGQEIRTVALRPDLTPAGLPLDLSDLHAGMYFYSLLVDGKVVTTKRLVLQN